MKSRRLTCIIAMLLVVAMPRSLAAQDKAKQHHHHGISLPARRFRDLRRYSSDVNIQPLNNLIKGK
jgi:hypothetical protein